MSENQLIIQKEPNSLETEQEILGSIFLENKLFEDVVDRIKYTTFHNELHQNIYTAMSYLFYNNQDIDYTSVIDRLETKKIKVDIDYILSLSDTVVSINNFEDKIKRLLDIEHKRNLYNVSKYILTENINGVSNQNLVKKIQSAIEEIDVVNNMEIVDVKQYANEWLEDFKKPISNNKLIFGFKKLDDLIGIETTGMTVIAGSTGSGKSALALAIAKNFCLQDRHVLFLTLEMSKRQVINRLIANISRVEHDKIKNKKLTEKWERDAVDKATKEVAKMNLYIYDRGSMSVEHLYNLTKKLKKQGKLDVIVVDYLQLLDTGKYNEGNNAQRIGYISRKLKMLAQDLYVPVIALSQLNRNIVDPKSGKRREPQLADLKESSAIEQDSNHVIMLHNKRDDTADPEDVDKAFIDIFVRKNREGTTGKIPTVFYGSILEFEEKQWDKEKNEYQTVEQINLKDSKEIVTDDDLPF